jgi:ribosomal protein RSM22 (predicted rRNA methylase)
MEKLDSFDFSKRPSRSRYAPVIEALLHGKTDDGKPVKAVRLKRGDDWPSDVNIDSVQGAIADQLRKVGKRAKTFRVDDNTLVVGLNDAPTPRRARRREVVAA